MLMMDVAIKVKCHVNDEMIVIFPGWRRKSTPILIFSNKFLVMHVQVLIPQTGISASDSAGEMLAMQVR